MNSGPQDPTYSTYPSEWFIAVAANTADLADGDLADALEAGHGSPVARVIARAMVAQAWASIAGAVATRERTAVIEQAVTSVRPEPGEDDQ